MDWIGIWRIAQVVLGIGLVIFVHESGHFIAARWCKVRVDVFSLGFGPKLWSKKRGDTTYQVALIPLGGYVKMAGEEPDEDGGMSPDDLRSKSVGQRFLIFSGGVIMNVVFGLVIFPILFWCGVPFVQPIMGPPTPGGPAWSAGLEAGTRVLEVNGQEIATFSEIANEVALGDATRCDLLVQRPNQEQADAITLTPRRSPQTGLYELAFPPATDPSGAVSVKKDSAADVAGVKEGDLLLKIEGALPQERLSATLARIAESGTPITATFEAKETGEVYTAQITPTESEQETPAVMGVSALVNVVADLRGAWSTVGVQAGDQLISLGGAPLWNSSDLSVALAQAEEGAEILVLRGKEEIGLPISDRSLLRAHDLALGADEAGRRVRVFPRSAADAAGMESGDEILQVNGISIGQDAPLIQTLQANTSAAPSWGCSVSEQQSISLLVRRGSGESERELELSVLPASRAPLDYGFGLKRADFIYSVANPLEAAAVGCKSCWKFLQDSWLTLEGIITKRVPSKNVGGPIAIGVIAHTFASVSWTKFFFFLCVLSMNLAFLNVLPIPLLDGGHLFFLLIEKIKGSPVSDRIMGYSQLAGLALIGFVFIYILYQDLQRAF